MNKFDLDSLGVTTIIHTHSEQKINHFDFGYESVWKNKINERFNILN